MPWGERPAPVEDDRPDRHARMVCVLPAGPAGQRAVGRATAAAAEAAWGGVAPAVAAWAVRRPTLALPGPDRLGRTAGRGPLTAPHARARRADHRRAWDTIGKDPQG